MGLTPRQRTALKRSQTSTINLWYGSVRSGKTIASIWDLLHAIATAPAQGVILIVGLTVTTVWRNIFVPLLTDPMFTIIAPQVHYREGASTALIMGREVHVVGANDETSWLKIQGLTVYYALGDEATGWPKSFWDMLITRLSMAESRLLVTCNPGTGNHHLKKEVIDRADADPDIHVEKMLLRDNPTLPASYRQRLDRIYTGLFYRRMVLAEWVAAEGAVYTAWNPGTMVMETPQLVQVFAVGIDYGTNHPTAGYAVGLGIDGRLHIFAEWSPNLSNDRHQRMTDAQLAESLQKWLSNLPEQPRFIYIDPSAASFRQELKTRYMRTHRADNSVLDGIRTVDSLLTNGDLKISPTCVRLIDEIPGYRWDAKASEKGRDQPIKESDDHCDGLRYTVYSCRHLWRGHLSQPHET